MERARLSEAVYLEVRLRFLDRSVLPPVYKVAEASKQSRPKLTLYRNGVRAHLAECLSLTLKERLSVLDLTGIQNNNLVFSFNYGLDGSGQHQNFQQLSKSHFSTKQIMNVCFSLKEILNSNGVLLWSSKDKGSNRPQNVRPLALFPEKETDEILKDFIPILDAEVEELKKEGLVISGENNQEIRANVDKATMSMIDGKMVTRLLQLGGAYCTMCTHTSEQCHDEDIISGGFQITRSTESLKDLALALEDSETGLIPRSTNDYHVRSGLTAAPLTSANVTDHIPVCHAKIRTFEWIIDLLCRENSHQKWSDRFKRQTYSPEEKELFKSEYQKLRSTLNEQLGINIGDPSEMVTGGAFKKFSTDTARSILANFIKDESKQESFKKIHLQICAVVLVLNSQKRKIQTEKLRTVCTDTNLEIRKTFPWAILSPSLHRILGHSWERVQMNGMFGLGSESEEGLEATNKLIRFYRAHSSRTTSTEAIFQKEEK
jgi:hypothetical protein